MQARLQRLLPLLISRRSELSRNSVERKRHREIARVDACKILAPEQICLQLCNVFSNPVARRKAYLDQLVLALLPFFRANLSDYKLLTQLYLFIARASAEQACLRLARSNEIFAFCIESHA